MLLQQANALISALRAVHAGWAFPSPEIKFSAVSVGSHKLNMQPGSRYVITSLPFPQFAQIHIKLLYVFGVWHRHTVSAEKMRVSLLNINAGPDARLAAGIYLNLIRQVWAQQVPSASRRSTQPLDHLEALKDYIYAEPRPDQYSCGGGGTGAVQEWESEVDCVFSVREGARR